MVLYPDELERISQAVRLTQEYHEEITGLYDSRAEVNFEGPEHITVRVFDVNGDEIGVIEYSDDGVIGFIPNQDRKS